MPHTAVWSLIGCMLLLPILLVVLLILLDVGIRGYAMWCLGDEFVGVRGRLLLVLLLGADEAEGPVGEVEAAEDDDCGEDLFELRVSGVAEVMSRRVVIDIRDFVLGVEAGRGCVAMSLSFPALSLDNSRLGAHVFIALAP